ncbi:uncharacterized protein LOC110813247 [Carica papaya]|uniref:uncharacterized protein LOC110813247 n=1 Tax=Carica papaya TaxID=3649 RepID=UPI000B8CFC95|nr:uncharacterized protein LOC110813247 [Carica papaya]
MAATTEEFSFPTITDCGIDSPPLWHLSPAASPDSFHQQIGDKLRAGREENNGFAASNSEPTRGNKQRKSFSYFGKYSSMVSDDEVEEKMDMLWEDFNEELKRSYSSRKESNSFPSGGDKNMKVNVIDLKLSKTGAGAAMISPRKPSLLVFIKVMKKLFLLHNSQRSNAWRL